MTLPCRKSDVLFVRWRDACGDSSRAMVEDARKAQLVVNCNVGWLLDEDDERIVLAHAASTGGEIDHFVIPTNCIVERVWVARPTKKATVSEDA